MLYNLIIKEEAKQDMMDAFLYYEDKQAGLGDQFLHQVELLLKKIANTPQYFSFIDDKRIFRDVALERFPYVIIYELTGSEILIFSIHLTHKDSKFYR